MGRTLWMLGLTMVALAGQSGCNETSIGFSSDASSRDDGGEAGTDWDNDNDTGSSETEDDFLAMAPAQTDVYVFVANPGRGTVTRIQVYSLEVHTAKVGNDPRVVRVTPEYDYAAVYNQADDSVSIVDSDTLDVTTTDVRDNYNEMLMSPDGRWVGLYHDRDNVRPDDPPPDGLQSFNEVSFVSVPDGVHHGMAVSYNPRDIKYSDDGTLAVVVSDEALALVDLTADVLIPTMIQVGEEGEAPKAEEVVLSRSGQFAYVRQFGADEILVVDLGTREKTWIPVGQNPTDLDLSPDGSTAVVVSRASQELWVIDAEQPYLDPKVVDLPADLSLGSLIFNRSGSQGVLYTTSTNTTSYGIWDVDTDSIIVHDLVKPVRSMAITPTGDSLLVLHTLEDAPETPVSDDFYGSWAMSLVSLDPSNYRENPIRLPAEPIGFSNSGDGQNGYFIMDQHKSLVEIDYRTLLYTELRLKSSPVYVGVLPDVDLEDGLRPPAWASQEHELGRITFYQPDKGKLQTITGFELNSQIED